MSSTNGFDMDSIEDSIEEIVMMMERSDWIKGISFSVAASIIGGASKLAIRKSWLLEEVEEERVLRGNSGALDDEIDDDHNNYQQQQGPVAVVNQNHHHHPTGSTTTTDRRRPHFRTTFWSLVWRSTGMFGMTILNPLCSVIAMNYASPSITAPFSGLTLVWIVLFSDCLIGEKPSMVQMVAAALIVLGETIVAVWGDHTSDNGVTLDDVVREKMAVKGRHSMFLRFPSRSPHFFVPLRKSKKTKPTNRQNAETFLYASGVCRLLFGLCRLVDLSRQVDAGRFVAHDATVCVGILGRVHYRYVIMKLPAPLVGSM
jgi:hypothetical protein